MKLYLNILTNTLHFDYCSHCSYSTLREFIKQDQEQNDSDFIFSTISHLVKVENIVNLKICPDCIGLKYNLLTDFNKHFS